LREKGMMLVLAESCTGGLIAHWITNTPGSSDYFLGGVVSYSNHMKERILGVQPATLETWGAVSEQVALEMAEGARRLLRHDFLPEKVLGLAVTGIAGPGGASIEKPVGLTWIAISGPQGRWTFSYTWNGNRIQNKRSSARQALTILSQYLSCTLPISSENPDIERKSTCTRSMRINRK